MDHGLPGATTFGLRQLILSSKVDVRGPRTSTLDERTNRAAQRLGRGGTGADAEKYVLHQGRQPPEYSLHDARRRRWKMGHQDCLSAMVVKRYNGIADSRDTSPDMQLCKINV